MWHLPKLSPVKDMLELFPFITSSLRLSILLRTELASFDVFTKSQKSMNCKMIFERYIPVYYKFWLEILITHLAIDLKLFVHIPPFSLLSMIVNYISLIKRCPQLWKNPLKNMGGTSNIELDSVWDSILSFTKRYDYSKICLKEPFCFLYIDI